jgi:small subunit ribosomal protein S6
MATKDTGLQNYELMVIFTPVLAEEDFKATQQRYSDMITSAGGKIVHSNPWGLRSLAYPIAKKTTGLYWVLEYQAMTDANAKLEIQMNRDESIMRHMITRLDKHAVAYNERKRTGVKHDRNAPEKSPEFDNMAAAETTNA